MPVRGLVGVIIVASCYAPEYGECEISCASGNGCPSSYTCDTTTSTCRSRSTSSCVGIGGDAGNPIDGDFACWMGVQPPTNFRPCDGDFPSPIDVAVTTPTMICTDRSGPCASAVPCAPGVIYKTDLGFAGQDVCLLHASMLQVAAPLFVVGERPLIIVADGPIDVAVSMFIDGSNAYSQLGVGITSDCSNGAAGQTGQFAGGGAGGGNSNAGGNGGSSQGATDGSTNTAPPPKSVATLVPLHPGCVGGAGGQSIGGAGGGGGAAIELVSAASITVSGYITTGGGGGGGGGMNAAGLIGGGGGGGAGGEILLEAPMIVVTASGSVFASGGGGGQGASAAIPGHDGSTGGIIGGLGGATTGAGGHGGAGSNMTNQQGGPGVAGVATESGGGGGGAAGRIRFHSSMPPVFPPNSVVPTPTN